jgi:hypothetical protein
MAQFPWSGPARRADQPERPSPAPQLPRLDAVRPKPRYVREPGAGGARAERRDLNARKALLRRVGSEFEEMPGLSLTLVQATRLFGIPGDMCLRVLVQLVETGRLRLTNDGRFALRVGAT